MFVKLQDLNNKILIFAMMVTLASANYDFDQLKHFVNESLNCLEKVELLSVNATFSAALGLAFLHFIHRSVPNLPQDRLAVVLSTEDRISALIEKGMKAYPDEPSNKIWRSKYYAYTGNYTFQSGLIPTEETLSSSLIDIINESIPKPLAQACFLNIMIANEVSVTPRKCIDPCWDIMKDINYNKDAPFHTKAWHIGYEMVMNCSTFNSGQYKAREVAVCKHLKKELNTMLKYKHTQEFLDTRYFFNAKVSICSSWGLPEFLTTDILTTVINGIDCHGCISNTHTLEDRDVLTAQTFSILAVAMRLVLETDAK